MEIKKIKRWSFVIILSLFFLGGIFVYQQARFFDGKLHIVFCRVGQGDGIFIRTPKAANIIIDGGPDNSILSCLSNNMPFWERKIDIVILTHPHEDHLNGLLDVIKRYNVLSFYTARVEGNFIQAEELEKALSEKNLSMKFLSKGDRLIIGELFLDTKYPYGDQKINLINAANEGSLVELLSFVKFKALFTGDADLKIISEDRRVDLLKMPHHGSKNNITEKILEKLNPEIAVITVGENKYGLPSKEVLGMLKKLGIKTLQTNLDGEVEVVSDGERWSLTK